MNNCQAQHTDKHSRGFSVIGGIDSMNTPAESQETEHFVESEMTLIYRQPSDPALLYTNL